MNVGVKSLESVQREDRVKVCPDCGSEEMGYDKGESFCKKMWFSS